MKNKPEERIIFSPEETELLQDMLTAYIEKLSKDDEAFRKYMMYAHLCGEISDSGDKYSNNIRFFDVKDKITDYISDLRIKSNKLTTKLYKLISKERGY